MAVRKIFWENPYLKEIIARITSVDHNIITLDQTIAYAFSGGQQSDSGTIGGYEIIEANKTGKEIYYKLPPDHNLEVGDQALVEVDWEKRYRIMRLHFAAELVLELVYQDFNHPQKIGANITSEKARLDFCWVGNIKETFPVIESKIRSLVDADLDITSDYNDEENEIRYWEIKGFAKVSCGGTHLRKTGEIGSISLKRVNLGGGKERIEVALVTR